MKKYDKVPLTHDQLLDLMQARGLAIPDRSVALNVLSRVSYYRLSTYFLPFQTERDRFRPGASFASLASLYEADEVLRIALFAALSKVEIALRARFVQTLTPKWGPFVHYQRELLRSDFSHDEWIGSIEREIERAKEPFIEHFRVTYEGFPRLPLWMAIEVMSLSSLSLSYSGLLPEPRRQIAAGLDLPHQVFQSWLHCLSYLRNACAHHARLWDRKLAIRPDLPRKHPLWTPLSIDNTRSFCAVPVLEWVSAWLGLPDTPLESLRRAFLGFTSIEPLWSKSMGISPYWRGGAIWGRD